MAAKRTAINPYGSSADQLRERFAAWANQGRGIEAFGHPVALEPALQLYTHEIRVPDRVDDGRRLPLWVSGLTLGLAGMLRRRERRVREATPALPPAATPRAIRELQILLASDFDPGRTSYSRLLNLAAAAQHPVSFELLGQGGAVSLQLACCASDADLVTRQVMAAAPSAAVVPRDGHLASIWRSSTAGVVIEEYGLAREFVRPLRFGKSFDNDPLTVLVEVLAEATGDELSLAQILWTPVRQSWAQQIQTVLEKAASDPVLATSARRVVPLSKEKTSTPLYACCIRLGIKAKSHERRHELLERGNAALAQLAQSPEGNELVRIDGGVDAPAREADLLQRTSHRPGFVVSANELASLVHLPGSDVGVGSLERMRQRTKRAPADTCGHSLRLGDNTHGGQQQVVTLSGDQRSRHIYIIGGTGTGKSTLLVNLIQQDIEAGHGVAVFDPHGDLVDDVLGRIPEARSRDVILIDPADTEYPVSVNVLAAHSELERTLLASDLVAAFRRQSTSWGDQMNAIFANAIMAFLYSEEGGTLRELRRLLVEKSFREDFLRTVTDPEVVYYWEKEFPLLRGNPQAPILTRLDAFLRPRLVRAIVANPGPGLDFRAVMDERRIVLARLSHGAIGEENAHLLGALLLSRFQQVALSRQDIDLAARTPFFIYLDEFANFATPSTETLLSGVRKYGPSLILAHQGLTQIPDTLLDAVFTNAGTRICFRVGDRDAKKLAEGFASYTAADLQKLDTGEAICRVSRADRDFNLCTYPVAELDRDVRQRRRAEVIHASRINWTRPRQAPVAVAPSPQTSQIAGAADQLMPGVAQAKPLDAPVAVPRKKQASRGQQPVLPGRGGQQHKYLQTLIKGLGEESGFRATIEHALPSGEGSVDVLLQRAETRIAFEISVTTPAAHELGNARKCLRAGFDLVVIVATNARAAARMRKQLVEEISADEFERVLCVVAEELPSVIEMLKTSSEPETVAGYQVRVRRRAGGDAAEAKKTVREIIARSLRRTES